MAKTPYSIANKISLENIKYDEGTRVLTVKDCGKTFLIENGLGGGTNIFLPALADAGSGWNATFIMAVSASAGNDDISVYSDTGDGSNTFAFVSIAGFKASGASPGQASSTVNNLVFMSQSMNVGDRLEVLSTSDGDFNSARWYAMGFVSSSLSILADP